MAPLPTVGPNGLIVTRHEPARRPSPTDSSRRVPKQWLNWELLFDGAL